MNVAGWVEQAVKRTSGHIRKTPLEHSAYLSDLTGAEVYLKLENQQITGSFKSRGAINKILSLPDTSLAKGIVVASTGNHAAAVAYASSIANTSALIYMPENTSEVKIKNLERFQNVEVKLVGKDSVDSEVEAKRIGLEKGLDYISPYNDPEIIGGQGTIAVELLDDLPKLTHVFVPIGGGGLIAGISGYLKSKKPEAKIIGCQPENSAVMYHSLKKGKVLNMESKPTISDGTAGGLELDSITFPIIQDNVNKIHLVSEDEILGALKILISQHYIMAEGAAGLSLASLIKNKALYKDSTVVLILCGNKMSTELLGRVLNYDN